jgi:hypothetical protein
VVGGEGQFEVEVPDQDFLISVELGVATEPENQRPAIGSGEVDVEHLDGREVVEHGSRGEAVGQRLEPRPQGDVKAIGHEGDEHVRFERSMIW